MKTMYKDTYIPDEWSLILKGTSFREPRLWPFQSTEGSSADPFGPMRKPEYSAPLEILTPEVTGI